MSTSLSIVADKQILFAEAAFSGFGKITLVDGRAIDHAVVKNADVLLVRSVTQVDAALLHDTHVCFVGSATSGVDHIDTQYLADAKIHFAHAPGSNARSVAEYVLSSLFAAAAYNDFDLTTKTVAIIGCGQIGSRVRDFLAVLGVRCLLNDPPLAAQSSSDHYVSLEQVWTADIITLHVPLVMAGPYPTNKLVNQAFLDRLKSDVVLINTARGEVVDEAALLAFKAANPEATLILDVWCDEPNIDVRLLQQSFIGTPHIAGYSYDGKCRATTMLVDALRAKMDGGADGAESATATVLQVLADHAGNAIQAAVMQAYDVRRDAIAADAFSRMSTADRAVYFDGLRKHYLVRREFTHWEVNTKQLNTKMIQRLVKLGFKAKVKGQSRRRGSHEAA